MLLCCLFSVCFGLGFLWIGFVSFVWFALLSFCFCFGFGLVWVSFSDTI